jgi:hypothetical protein
MTALLESIEELLLAPAPDDDGVDDAVARIEQTLTEGYAHALALEARRWRLHREMNEAAVGLEPGDRKRVHEVSTLADKLASTDADLTRLRELLEALRGRARDLRLHVGRAAAS